MGFDTAPGPLASVEDYSRTVFSVEGLSFSWQGGRTVLEDASFALYPGQCVGLRGKNGSGKTTFFRCVTGLLRPQAGLVRLGAVPLQKENDFRALRREVGFVLQNPEDQLFFPSVIEDLSFGPLNLGLSWEESRQRARESLNMVGLDGFEERLTHQLSGGEKKLAAIAAILAMRPKALLLDEPLTGLDERAAARVEKVIKTLECARVVIDHDSAFLRNVCHCVVELKDGRFHPADIPS